MSSHSSRRVVRPTQALRSFLSVSLMGLVLAAPAARAEFSYSIDPDLRPAVEVIEGVAGGPPRAVGAVLDPDGGRDDFVRAEVIIEARELAVLEAFAARTGGVVLDGGPLPAPPAIIAPEVIDHEAGVADFYLVRIDPAQIFYEEAEFLQWMQQLEFDGHFVFGSVEDVKLSALLARERVANGLNVTPNPITRPGTPDCVLSESEERPTPPLFINGFTFDWARDAEILVTRAWQYFDLLDLAPASHTVGFAILDQGFALNADFPLPASVAQWDLIDDDGSVNNQAESDGGWHGTGVMGVSVAGIDDRFGAIGTAGPASTSLHLIRIGSSLWSMGKGFKMARQWGVDVVNISWGAECNWWCRNYGIFSGSGFIGSQAGQARDKGVVIVASAGNDELDLDDEAVYPCELASVLCVGAIDLATKDAVRSSTHGWGSNYDGAVDIWAPGDFILTTPTPATGSNLSSFDGTSAAAPFVAGIVAMMKAIDPTIDMTAARSILQTTANSSSDGRVSQGYVDAYEAVKAAAARASISPMGDAHEPNDTPATAAPLSTGTTTGTIAPGDVDYFELNLTDIVDLDLWVMDVERVTPQNFLRAELDNVGGTPTAGLNDLDRSEVVFGKHELGIWGATPDTINCYDIAFSTTPSVITPDRFDDEIPTGEQRNDTFADRTKLPIVLQPHPYIVQSELDLNFHLSGDVDYFEVQLPPATDPQTGDTECLAPGNFPYGEPSFVQGFFEVRTFPGPNGGKWPFVVTFYNADGSVLAPTSSTPGHSARIECPNALDDKLRFSVASQGGRRNFYEISLQYSRWDAIFDIPLWMWDEVQPPGLRFPVPPWQGLSLPTVFPWDPWLMSRVLAEQPIDLGEEDWIALPWTGGDLELNLLSEGGRPLEVSLYDEQRELIAETPGAGAGASDAIEPTGLTSLRINALQEGIYAMAVRAEPLTRYSFYAGPPASANHWDEARPIGPGRHLGILRDATPVMPCGCDGGEDLPDVWYEFVPDSAGRIMASTCGSNDLGGVDQGVDTVVALFRRHPEGFPSDELTCNDDWPQSDHVAFCEEVDHEQLLDSSLALDVEAGEPVLIRVAARADAPGGAFLLHLEFEPREDDCGNGVVDGDEQCDGTPHCSDACRYICPGPLMGDANDDGRVDGADYTLWADHFGQGEVGFHEGNFNCDDEVDGADYTLWADHFGATLADGGSAASAPGCGLGGELALLIPLLVWLRRPKAKRWIHQRPQA